MLSSNVHLCLHVGNSITPDPEVLPKTSGLGGSNTITLLVGSSDICSCVSVFVLFIFTKDFWILFRHTNSAGFFDHDIITRRVALLESDPVPDSQPDICLHHVKTNTYIYIYIYLSIYLSIYSHHPSLLTLGLIGRDGGLSTLCHSCGFASQQRVLKMFPGPGCLHSEDGVV